MIKADLKARWGQYTDTDKLVDDIMSLLKTYKHPNTEHGVCKMLDKYFTKKEPLIKLFKKSTSYIGDMRIRLTKEFERDKDKYQIMGFCDAFPRNVEADKVLIKYVDDDGKKMEDYFKIGLKSVNLKTADFTSETFKLSSKLSLFDNTKRTIESYKHYDRFLTAMYKFRNIYNTALNASQVTIISAYANGAKLAEGLKTSRAFNRVCEAYGITQATNYNKLFAQYSDMVSEGKRTLDFIMSLNPYDYLTMSFGNSWSSCHTIAKPGTYCPRVPYSDGYGGQWCAGTLSYMLDASSIITYVVGHGEDPQTTDKIYRNMFHYQDFNLVQGRIYPQSHDGSTDLYKVFRSIVHDEMAVLLELKSNSWKVTTKREGFANWTYTSGLHYPDYQYNGDCNLSYPTEKIGYRGTVYIGTSAICPKCGEQQVDFKGRLTHISC